MNPTLHIRILGCLCAAALAFTTIARADAPDTSTPKKAAIAFANALKTGDIATAKTLATGNDAEWALVKILSDAMVATNAFSAVATDKFGPDAKLPAGFTMDLAAEFDAADEKIDGDTATLISKSKPNDPNPPTLKKTAKGWVLDLSNMDKDPSTPTITQMLPLVDKALNTVTANIKAGKYKSFDEAMTAFQGLVQAAASAGGPGAAGSGPAQ